MRQAFLESLLTLAEQDASVMLLTADTGFHVFDEFQKMYPENYCNVGISEAAMIGIAAGLALEGNNVFVYGIAPFVTFRCFEQIRVDLCYQKLPVKIVGVGAGLTYGSAGPSHHSIEDIAVMNSLPGMTVLCPGDPVETSLLTRASMQLTGPCYLRLGKSGEATVHKNEIEDFSIGKGIVLREGKDIVIIATGNMLPNAAHVCELLGGHGISAGLVSMPTIKPFDRELVVELAKKYPALVTIEEHSVIGGLGSVTANVLCEEALPARLLKFAVPDCYVQSAGSQDFFREQFGLTPELVANKIIGLRQ